LKKYWLWKVVGNKSFQIDIIYLFIYLFQIDTISSLSSAACTLAWFFYIKKNSRIRVLLGYQSFWGPKS